MNRHLPDYYEKNMALLKVHHPSVHTMITSAPPMPLGEVFLGPDGKLNIRIQRSAEPSFCLHHETDPEQEISEFMKLIPPDHNGFVSLIGMGLGYTPLGLLKHRPDIRFLSIFEPTRGVFVQALRYMDLTPLLTDSRVILSLSPDPEIPRLLEPALWTLRFETIHTLIHKPSFQMDNAVYSALNKKLFTFLNEMNVDGQTTLAYGDIYLRNRLSVLSAVCHHELLESLKDVFSGVPAIIVGGGPSLDKNIQLLNHAKNKAVIISVDAALPALTARGIAPDFLCSIDPTDFTYEKVASSAFAAKGIYLICMPWVNPKIPKIFPADGVFWGFSMNNFEKWMNSLIGGKILTRGAGTVSHLGFIAAEIMGCSPIVFVGQDLAYSDTHSHAEHTVLSADDLMERTMKAGSDLQWVEGWHNDEVPTNRAFFSMKKMFENMISVGNRLYINATEGGAHIEGTLVLPLHDVLEKYCREQIDIHAHITKQIKHICKPNVHKLIQGLEKVRQKSIDIHELTKKAEDSIQKLDDAFQHYILTCRKFRSALDLPHAFQAKFRKVEANNRKLDDAVSFWAILDDVTLKGLRESERMMLEIKRIEKEPEKYMELIQKIIKRFAYINDVRRQVSDRFISDLDLLLCHLEEEQQLFDAIQKQEDLIENKKKLARLYFQSGDFMLLKPVLDDLYDVCPDSADINYYLGMLALYHEAYDEAEAYFSMACSLDIKMKKRIRRFNYSLGDQYYGYKRRSLFLGRNVYIRMLLKGLRCCPEHRDIRRELQTMADEDLRRIQEDVASASPGGASGVIDEWIKNLELSKDLPGCLTAERVAEFYRYQGVFLLSKQDYSAAVLYFEKALACMPENAEYQILMAEAQLATGNVEQAFQNIEKAVEYDRKYAIFWENIGDSLLSSGQQNQAVAAYERCIESLPKFKRVKEKIEKYRVGDEVKKLGS